MNSSAQNPLYYFHNLTKSDNLSSQSNNLYIFQDSKGFVWISSLHGLNRFDGNSVRVYKSDSVDVHSLADNNIHSKFFEDEEGDLWFSSNFALHKYVRKRDHFERYYLPKDPDDLQDEYQLLFLDTRSKKLWIRNQSQLYQCDLHNPTKLKKVGSFDFDVRARIEKGPKSKNLFLFLSNSKGLDVLRYNGESFLPYLAYKGIDKKEANRASAFYLHNEDEIWLSTQNDLLQCIYGQGCKKKTFVYKGKELNEITEILRWEESNLLISTNRSGIYIYDPRDERVISEVFSDERDRILPFPYQVERMYISQDKTLWLSSQKNGIFYTQPGKRKFQSFLPNYSNKSDPLNFIRALTEDEEGNIAALTRAGVYAFKEDGKKSNQWGISENGQPFQEKEPYYIMYDEESGLWVCAQNGLFLLEAGERAFKKIESINGDTPTDFIFIRLLQNGKILGTSRGIYEIQKQGGRWNMKSMKDISNAHQRYAAIFEDPQGNVFVSRFGTHILVLGYNSDHDTFLPIDSIEFSHMVNAMIPLAEKQGMWIASDAGLHRMMYVNNSYQLIFEQEFPISPINGMLKDESGKLWLTSTEGLYLYDPRTKSWESFDLADGLQNLEFNYWSALRTRKGQFAFGGVDGITLVDPQNVSFLDSTARPTIVDIQVNNLPLNPLQFCTKTGATNVSEIQELLLENDENTISVKFSAMDFGSRRGVNYRFDLINELGDTLDNGFQSEVTFANMNPGTYYLNLAATNSDGIWSRTEDTRKLIFTILPHWSETFWFRALAFVALAFLLFTIYQNQMEHSRKKQKLTEYRLRVSEIETAILRTQMNPHFIFNSLNSIRGYVLEKDIRTADDFLTHLSKLMRKILNIAPEELVDLAQEQDLLEEYIEVEKLRLEIDISYTFEYDKGIDARETKLPSMILQPFVENAIIHGFSRRNGPYQLNFRFWLMEGSLFCSIQDNGIGRTQAGKTHKNHVSKATSITHKRLQLLEEQYNSPTSLEIIDLLNENKEAMGTKILIRIPKL